MKHIIDGDGNVCSYRDENYFTMIKKLKNMRVDLSASYIELTLDVGQVWYVQINDILDLRVLEIENLSDKTITLKRHDDRWANSFTREFKYLKFIERLK